MTGIRDMHRVQFSYAGRGGSGWCVVRMRDFVRNSFELCRQSTSTILPAGMSCVTREIRRRLHIFNIAGSGVRLQMTTDSSRWSARRRHSLRIIYLRLSSYGITPTHLQMRTSNET